MIRQILIRLLSTIIASYVLLGLLIKRLLSGPEFFRVKPRPTPPAIATDQRWGVHKFMTLKKQGIRLHYVEKGDSSKPLILCVHGFPECWFSWRHQLEGLADKYWVVAIDMRGYGDSSKPSGKSAYAMQNMVEDIKEFILALGKPKCTIVAHDWGALIAWDLVIEYPELFESHVSCNGPHLGAFLKLLKNSWKQKFMSWYIAFFQTPWVPELSISVNDLQAFDRMLGSNKKYKNNYPDEVREVFKYYFSQKGALTPPINYYRNIDFGQRTENLPKVKVPTLVIWGCNDLALSLDVPITSAAVCETCEIKYIKDATHWVQQDEPQEVNNLIKEYLAKNNF